MGSMLTYDTTLQVISWAAQKDLLLHDSLLGGHFGGFLLLAGIGPAGEEGERGGEGEGGGESRGGRGGRGGGVEEERLRLDQARGQSRTSCGAMEAE